MKVANEPTANTVTPRSGTPVQIKITESIDSGQAVEGSTIFFKVISDIKEDGKVLVRAGEMGSAQVTSSDERGIIGQEGKLVISDFSTRAVDGTYVPLRGTVSHKGQSKMVQSLVLGLFICPPFLIIKGKDAQIPAGFEKTVYTGADVQVKVQAE